MADQDSAQLPLVDLLEENERLRVKNKQLLEENERLRAELAEMPPPEWHDD